MRRLTVEPEFENKIPPLSADEFSRLEANILEDGEVREPIVIWGNTIIDGHNRWKIIQKHPELKWTVKQMDFQDKWDAIAWMCRNQLGRRNLTEEQKSYLRGKQYEAEKISITNEAGVNQYSEVAGQNVRQPKSRREQRDGTAGRIGKENGVDGKTIRRDAYFASGLDAAEEASPGIREVILSGEIKVPKSTIAAIRNIPEEQRTAAVEAIKRGKTPEPIKKSKAKREGYRQRMRNENNLISSVVSSLYDDVNPVEHTVDHFLEDLSAMTEDFTKKLTHSFDIFAETLDKSGSKEKVSDFISDFLDKVEEIRRENCD